MFRLNQLLKGFTGFSDNNKMQFSLYSLPVLRVFYKQAKNICVNDYNGEKAKYFYV